MDVIFITGDCNKNVKNIRNSIPTYSKENTVLSFCFIDPYKININFSTVKHLGQNLMDFLILLPLHMDINRALKTYFDPDNKALTEFLGTDEWRKKFNLEDLDNKKFLRFISSTYDKQMIKLGYKEPEHKFQVRSSEKNLPLYHLAFYSKSERGNDFYVKVKRSANSQRSLGI